MDYLSLRKELKEIIATVESVPEQFKEKCFEILFNRLIDETLPGLRLNPPPPPTPTADINPTFSPSAYINVISIDGDSIKIIKSLPGNTTAKKTVNAALLYLYGKLVLGKDEAAFSEIQAVCKDHGCLDLSNFAGYLKSRKTLFLISGERNKTIKLTVPGKTEASALVATLNT